MSQNDDRPDTSSIRPISSLRSKFENLGKDASPVSPVTFRSFAPPPDAALSGTRTQPSRTKDEKSEADRGPDSRSTTQTTLAALRLHKDRPDPTAPRPLSMISMSPLLHAASTPLVTVESPPSPQKTASVDLRTTRNAPSLQPLSLYPTTDAQRPLSRTEERAATAVPITRGSAFQPSTIDSPILSHDVGNATDLEHDRQTAALSTQAAPVKGPPVVNRAAKPKVPVKPVDLTKQTTNLTAPELNSDLTDQSISPFNTPPGSGSSSPVRKEYSTSQQQAHGQAHGQDTTSGSYTTQRPRNDSDASWVQRIRGFSDVPTVERARAESNASFVEPSLLPDSWQQQPIQYMAVAQGERPKYGLAKAPTMPARYRTMTDERPQSNDEMSEDRPRLPARPELQIRPRRGSPPKIKSGRTSPLKATQTLSSRRSTDMLRSSSPLSSTDGSRTPTLSGHGSALSQGFGRVAGVVPLAAPAVPPSRRSVERRRDTPAPPQPAVSAPTSSATILMNGTSHDDEDDPTSYGLNNETVPGPTDFPDATRANRRAPRFKQRPWQIPTNYDTRLFAVCGEYVCTTGYVTKAWNLRTGEELLHLSHRENVKATSIVFKPSSKIEDEGKRVWLGMNVGEIQEVDIPSQSIVKSRPDAHKRREIIRMFRYASELWTLDDSGELYVWKPDHKGMPSLDSNNVKWSLKRGHSYSIACGKQLWIATGKEIRVYRPSAQSDTDFRASKEPLSQPGTGDVTAGAILDGNPDLIYFGHADGKVSIYNRRDFTCRALVSVSVYKIVCLAGVGDYLWAGYSTGMAYVYDISTRPWIVRKDWKAHDKQICGIVADPSSIWKMGRLNVVTLGIDNHLRFWDGMLETDWLDGQMSTRDSEFSSFGEMTAAVLTWNAGASKPSWLGQTKEDSNFFREYLGSGEPPDIFMFGFQELVDLEDKKMTAKALFKSKKKDPTEQEHMSRQYRAWRDHLTRCVDEYMPGDQAYTLLHTTSMVGLFTCIFVKTHIRQRIRHVHTSEVKRGMGGHHGNKGALILRMVLDDSSICFVNCHLAAGQTQTLHRNNDVAEILEANALPTYPIHDVEIARHSDIFTAGGDGSMILDHEICILNGDLNYRIDTMGRDAVIKQVIQGNLTKLLDRDQLLLSKKKNPGFRLRAFQESPINFVPTYKYNVGTDDYDTSEKRRAPAWCDRILYRGLGKVKMEDYRRWDQLRLSDHRPVSGRLRLRVKKVDADKREIIWTRCEKELDGVRQRIARAAQLGYLVHVLGMTAEDADVALQGI